MKLYVLPKSRLGAWSAGLTAFSIVTMICLYVFAERMDLISNELIVAVLGAAAVIAAFVALLMGLVAVIRNKEQSIFVFVSILLGAIVLGFVIFGE